MRKRQTPKASSLAVRARMRATSQRDTPAELELRSELRELDLRFSANKRVLPDSRRTADVVFARAKLAIFVDGCFWHGCPKHGSLPKKTNRRWWTEKIAANRKRDKDTNRRLRNAGWRVMRIWEHEDPVRAARRIGALVRSKLGA